MTWEKVLQHVATGGNGGDPQLDVGAALGVGATCRKLAAVQIRKSGGTTPNCRSRRPLKRRRLQLPKRPLRRLRRWRTREGLPGRIAAFLHRDRRGWIPMGLVRVDRAIPEGGLVLTSEMRQPVTKTAHLPYEPAAVPVKIPLISGSAAYGLR